MLSRREFLKNFALGVAGLYVAPKTLIFDMGANSRPIELIYREFVTPSYCITEIQASKEFQAMYEELVKKIFLAAPPLLPPSIYDAAIKNPEFLHDCFSPEDPTYVWKIPNV